MGQGCTLWFTGLSGAGKSTIATLVSQELLTRHVAVEVLDGDEIRTTLGKGLGFSKEDRDTNIKRIGYVAKLLTRHGVIVITAAISPYRQTRDAIRQDIPDFLEVYVRCPLAVCMDRDVKGLYQKALAGEIRHFTGIDDPYEEPLHPDLIVNTHFETPSQSAAKVLAMLEQHGKVNKLNTTERSYIL